jgi:hypothetical protein
MNTNPDTTQDIVLEDETPRSESTYEITGEELKTSTSKSVKK